MRMESVDRRTPTLSWSWDLVECGLLGGLLAASPCAVSGGQAPALCVSVNVDKPGAPPTRYGVFFEDINYGADGGLYPERIKNRSFEFTDPLMGWRQQSQGSAAGTIEVRDERPMNSNNPHYLRMTASGEGFGIVNEGFFGVGVERGAEFVFSACLRSADSAPPCLGVEVLDSKNQPLARALIKGAGSEWQRFETKLAFKASEAKGRLRLWLSGRGTLDMDMVSLFPKATWKNRRNGLRPDLVKWLADLKPGFLRFPGGCIVEGRYLSTRYQWKSTIGELPERRLIINRWNDEFKHRPAPDYFQSFGLGFFEFFLLCEDIGAEPLPILNCGMACQFNSNELAPLDQLAPYIQDALDLIEFANGPASSPWGARRAAMGHPQPFGLKSLGVGNEQWGPQYVERYVKFAQALKAKYPAVQLVSSAGPRPADDLFHFLWPKLREQKADIVDEHCYDRPAWFLDNAFRYDGYDRKGPKVFMGEYAAQSDKVVSPENRNNWECALAEAAYMVGLERNSEVVTMASYAPLFAHEEGWQWRPNLLWFDNLRSYATPNYYVQQMFSVHRGDALLLATVTGQPVPSSTQPGLYATASRDQAAGEVVLKVVNSAAETRTAQVRLDGATKVASSGKVILLNARDGNLAAENSMKSPLEVAPKTSTLRGVASSFTHAFPPRSFTVLRLKAGP